MYPRIPLGNFSGLPPEISPGVYLGILLGISLEIPAGIFLGTPPEIIKGLNHYCYCYLVSVFVLSCLLSIGQSYVTLFFMVALCIAFVFYYLFMYFVSFSVILSSFKSNFALHFILEFSLNCFHFLALGVSFFNR